MQRIHPSVFLWLEGSDEAPPDEIDKMFWDTFIEQKFNNPVIISAADDVSHYSGFSGVKMEGPYAWVPPNYWLSQPPLPNKTANANF